MNHARDTYGLQIVQQNLNDARTAYNARITAAHNNGMSLRAIAAVLGISHQTVHNIITAHKND